MSCNCNTSTNTSCECQPCNTVVTECDCPIKDLSTDCILYTGDDLDCSGIESNTLLTESLVQLDRFICDKFDEAINYLTLTNIGEGAEVYKGVSNIGEKEIRTITGETPITISQEEDSIKVGIDPNWITDSVDGAIEDSIISLAASKSLDIYKGYNQLTNQHEIKGITNKGSSAISAIELVTEDDEEENIEIAKLDSDTLDIIKDEEDGTIYIEVPTVTNVKSFYVNNTYTGVEAKGTIAKPYKDLDTAIAEYIGTGTIVSPQYNTSRIIVQPSGSHYDFDTNLGIKDLKIEIEVGAIINYTGSISDYALDTRLIHAHPDYDNASSTFIHLFGEGDFYSTKGIIYAEGTGADGVTTFNQTAVLIKDNLKLSQYYDTNNTVLIPVTSGGTDYMKTGANDINFYEGDSNTLPAIVLDGDNGNAVNISMSKGMTLSLTTQTGVLIKNEGYLLQNRLATEALTISNLSVHGIYGGLENVGVGNPNVLIPNEDFNFIRVEGERTVCSIQNIFMSTVSAYARAAIKIGNLSEPANINIISLVINKGNFFSTEEFNHAVYIEEVPHSVYLKDIKTNSASKEEAVAYNSLGTSVSVTITDCDIDKAVSSNIDLTKNNTISVENRLEGKIVKSLQKFGNRITAATVLPTGGQFINTFGGDPDTALHFLDTVM